LGSDLSFGLSVVDQPRTNPKMSAQLIHSLDWDQTLSVTSVSVFGLGERLIQKVKSPIETESLECCSGGGICFRPCGVEAYLFYIYCKFSVYAWAV